MKTQIQLTLLAGMLCFTTTLSMGQSAADALRYSLLDPTGTARFAGAGGAFTALGADYGGITLNPAGAAMFRKNQFVVGTGMRFHKTETALDNTPSVDYEERRSNFQLENLALVFHKKPRRGKLTTFNTVIGYNRTANFNRKYYFEGDAKGSIVSTFFDDAQLSGDPDNYYPFGAGLAYDAEALYDGDFNSNNGVQLTSDFEGNRDAVLGRSQFISERGGMGEMQFGFAGSYQDKLMVGITAGLPLVNYERSSVYDENDGQGNVDFFDRLSYTESLRSEGVGFNLKLGAIYRATQAIRIGASVHTPTFMALNDQFDASLNYVYTGTDGSLVDKSAQSPDGVFDYRLNTPLRASVGAAVVISDKGFLSGDVEFVDYSAARFNFTKDVNSNDNAQAEREVNTEIERAYQSAINFRFGGEYAHEELRLRAGAQLIGNAYAKGGDTNLIYTGGIGYRGESFYMDLAYRRLQSNFGIQTYQSGSNTLSATSQVGNNDFILTLGFQF